MKKVTKIKSGKTTKLDLKKLLKESDGITINEVKPMDDKDIEWVSVGELGRRLYAKGFTGWGKDRLQMHAFRFGMIKWEMNKREREGTSTATKFTYVNRGWVTLNYKGMMNYIEFLSGLDSKFIPLPIPQDNHQMFSLMQICMRYKLKVYMVYGTPAVSIADWLFVVNYLMCKDETGCIDIEQPVHWEDVFQYHAKLLNYRMFYKVGVDYRVDYDIANAGSVMRQLSAKHEEWHDADREAPLEDDAIFVKRVNYTKYGERTYIRVLTRASCGGDACIPTGCTGWYCVETGMFVKYVSGRLQKGRLRPIPCEEWQYAEEPKRVKAGYRQSAYLKTPLNYNDDRRKK